MDEKIENFARSYRPTNIDEMSGRTGAKHRDSGFRQYDVPWYPRGAIIQGRQSYSQTYLTPSFERESSLLRNMLWK